MKPTDITVENVSFAFEDFAYRTPIKFGGTAVDQVTLANVEIDVRTESGQAGKGFGSMPMGNVWSFPSKVLKYEQTLTAMKKLVERLARLYGDCKLSGHPIDLTMTLEEEFSRLGLEVETELQLAEPVPILCTMVAASPFDAALHDAFGKVHGKNCYQTYGPEFMSHDLARYLGVEFAGDQLAKYLLPQPQQTLPLYHLVGALDPLEESDIVTRLDDGMPETLPEWIRFNGLTHIKIKLNGDDLDWDVDRVVRIDRVTGDTQAELGVDRWFYSCDFNERCANVAYLVDFLQRVKEKTPAGLERIQYIEQPTARDLRANRENIMHEASKVRPVVIDESLVALASLKLAREMGYTGAALKACKGQSQSLLMAAAAQKFGMFLCVQDLTCPGASLIHSAGLAAHVPGVAAIEANARQYVPAANEPWLDRFPGIFRIADGTMKTSVLTGLGLSAVRG